MIVAHDKKFICSQRDGLVRQTRIFNRSVIFCLCKFRAVNINFTVCDLNGFARKGNDSFYIIGVFLIFRREYDDVKALRIRKMVGNLVHQENIFLLQGRVHA